MHMQMTLVSFCYHTERMVGAQEHVLREIRLTGAQISSCTSAAITMKTQWNPL